MSICSKNFGKTKNNVDVDLFTITNNNGMTVKVMTYGATITSISVPNRDGNFDDVVLGYDNITSYENGDKFFGAVIGRCANRIANGKFKINDNEYTLVQNNGKNHLHGGIKGFDKAVWNAFIVSNEKNILELSYYSKDGEEGYPGNVKVTVTYTLTDENELKLHYNAISDKDTIVNLTNHSYFNLNGHNSGTILKHKLLVNADTFTENDATSIPTGKILAVKDTPMNFTSLKTIGDDIESDYEQIKFGLGYDHNWLLNTKGNLSIMAAKLICEESGRVLEAYTTKPGIQVYTANFLDGSDIGKDHAPYEQRTAVCLETQYVPNAINNTAFPSPILKAYEKYEHFTVYKFSTL